VDGIEVLNEVVQVSIALAASRTARLGLGAGPVLASLSANHGPHKSHNGDSYTGISATQSFNMINRFDFTSPVV